MLCFNFWKKKEEKPETEPEMKVENEPVYPEPEIKHTRAVIDGKLYDTETAEELCEYGYFALFRTKKGNYFCCDVLDDAQFLRAKTIAMTGNIRKRSYYAIKKLDLESAKKILAEYNIEKYIELFGKPEEA